MALNYWTDEAGNINFGAPPQGNLSTMQPAAQTSMPAPTVAPAPSAAPPQAYGTDFAAQWQNTLGSLMAGQQFPYTWPGTQQTPSGQGQFDQAFYLAQNPDVAKAVQWGQFPSAYAHYNQFGAGEGRAPNSSASLVYGGRQTPSMDYGSTINNFGAGRAAPTFGSTAMPNQYQQRQTVAPTAWQGMQGSPFTGAYNNMATMPMLSALQNSPYASLFGMVPQAQTGMVTPPAAPQSFQIANGTTISGTPEKAFGGMSKTDFIRNGPNAYREMKRPALMKLQDRMKMQQRPALEAQRLARRASAGPGNKGGLLNRSMQASLPWQPGPSPYSLQQQRPWLFN